MTNLQDFKYYKSITLNTGTPTSNFKLKVSLNTSNFPYAKAKSNGGDIRFYSISRISGQSDEKLTYYNESFNVGGTSVFWVVVPTAGITHLFMVYGNSSANSESTGTAGTDDSQPSLTFGSEINLTDGTYSENGLIAFYDFDNISQVSDTLVSNNNNLSNNTFDESIYTFFNNDNSVSLTTYRGTLGSPTASDVSSNGIVLNTSATNTLGNYLYLQSTNVSNFNGKTLYISFTQTNNTNPWQRIFDFHDGTTDRYIFFTPYNSDGVARMVLKDSGGEVVDSFSSLSLNVKYHLLVYFDIVSATELGVFYSLYNDNNGSPLLIRNSYIRSNSVGGTTTTLFASSLNQLWFGRSIYAGDTLFNGIYHKILLFDGNKTASIKPVNVSDTSLNIFPINMDISNFGQTGVLNQGLNIFTSSTLSLSKFALLPSFNILGNSPRTFSFWFKIPTINRSSGYNQYFLFNISTLNPKSSPGGTEVGPVVNGGAGLGTGFGIWIDTYAPSYTPNFNLRTHGSGYSANVDISDNTWHHCALTYDSSYSNQIITSGTIPGGRMKVYLDGIIVGTVHDRYLNTLPSNTTYYGYRNNQSVDRFGYYSQDFDQLFVTNNHNYFMDEFFVYNRELSPGEVLQIYNRRLDVDSTLFSSEYSTEASQLTLLDTTVLTASNIRANSLRLNWYDISGANTYNIQISDLSTNNYSSLVDLSFGTIFYDISNYDVSNTIIDISENTVYYFKLAAINGINNGEYTDDLYVLTLLATPILTIITGVETSSSIDLSWNPISARASYTIQYSESAGMSPVSEITGVANTYYTVTGLKPFTTYYFRVIAISIVQNDNDSQTSNQENQITLKGTVNVIDTILYNKIYDGSTNALFKSYGSLSGVDNRHTVTMFSDLALATLATSDISLNIPITITNYDMSGIDAFRYNIIQPTGLTANIYPQLLNVVGPTKTTVINTAIDVSINDLTIFSAYNITNPYDISGILLWLDANETDTFILSDTDISSWNNKLGSYDNATSRIGTINGREFYAPRLLSNYINGKSVVDLSGSNFLTVNNNFNNNSISFVILVKLLPGNRRQDGSIVNRNYGIISLETNNLFGRSIGIYNGTFYIGSDNNQTDTGITFTDDTWYILSINLSTTEANSYFRVNGTSTTFTIYTSTPDNTTGLKIGIYNDASGYPSTNMLVAETMLFNRTLTTSELEGIEGYLSHKWNLSSNLPDTHPYKTYNPNTGLISGDIITGINFNDLSFGRTTKTTAITPSNIIITEGGNDHTNNYDITYNDGLLIVKLAKPIDISAYDRTDLTLSLSWTDNINPDIDISNYRVYYKPISSSTWLQSDNTDITTTHTITGLIPNTNYEFKVKAISNN